MAMPWLSPVEDVGIWPHYTKKYRWIAELDEWFGLE